MNREDLINRLRKMKALAQGGVGGERENAERLIDELAARHGIDLDDLGDDAVEKFVIKVPVGWRMSLFNQLLGLMRQRLAANGASHDEKRLYVWVIRIKGVGRGRSVTYFTYATKSEWVEAVAKYEVLARAYKRQLDVFHTAFLMANHLLLEPTDDEPGQSLSKPSEEERRRMFEAAVMSRGIGRTELHGEIECKEAE